MALTLANRVRETTTTTGTGTVTLAGAVTGYQSFSVIGNANTTYYTISGQGTSEFEVGIGTYTLSGTTLSRDTVLASSNAGSAVNFSAGTKDVFVTYPSNKAVYLDASGNASALGIPASGTVTNLTGTASININGTVGATTATTGAFTTGSFSGVVAHAAGTVAAPSIYLSTDTGTGLYRIGANNDGFAINGAKVLDIASTGLAVTGSISATTTVAGSGGASTLSVATRQVFLTGTAATYTTPANCRRIVVRMKGPGGSTHGSSTSADGGGAGAGTATSFNSITAAVGGNSGQASGGKPSGGSGGTGGTGTASLRIAGAMGHAQTTPYATGTTAYLIGGNGGGTGGGLAKDPTAYGTASGSAGVANSGGGASGAGLTTALLFASASGGWVSGGGGEGEYAEITISSPAGTYTYTVGTAGAGGIAGTSGVVGAAGGSGFIYVDEYY